ncbi:esterase [Leeuwenhoekiella sp. NPDC079379]|uniref:esterase n=1 Tax=Leeuwenhoekiella sp. NPDC079379 TaxID=3364122 RepID=UPI0037CBBA0B
MKKYLLLLILSVTFFAQAQDTLFGAPDELTPKINDDKTVTFTLRAPKADSVQVTGAFLPFTKVKSPMGDMDKEGIANMTKDENGIWSFTTPVLPSDLYKYHFIVDGLRVADPTNSFGLRDVSAITNFFIVPGDRADLYMVQDVPHGTLASRWYDSPGLGIDRKLSIYTPPGYEDSKADYPVLYLLHGAGGDEEAWLNLGRTVQILDNLIAQGKAEPMLVVMPNGNVDQDAAPGAGSRGYYMPTFFTAETMNGKYEANFKDVINFVESNYRVKAEQASRAIAGLSMGGYHTMHISRFYPGTFDYVGLFSAAINPRADQSGVGVYDDLDGTLKTQMEKGYKLYYMAIGETDFLYKTNELFRARLDKLGMPYEYVENGDGHIWRNWRIYLSEFVPRLFQE